MAFVLAISFKIKNMSILVVCGIMIGYICSAITDFCVTFASDSNIVNLHNWSMGSFSGMSWDKYKSDEHDRGDNCHSNILSFRNR